MRIQTAAL